VRRPRRGMAWLGSGGRGVTEELAGERGLGVRPATWHGDRSAFAEVACAIGIACGSLAKFATDIVLLMQTEVAEVFEVPLSFIVDPANHQRANREYKGRMRHFFVLPYENRYIWRATAGMLVNLAEVLDA